MPPYKDLFSMKTKLLLLKSSAHLKKKKNSLVVEKQTFGGT